jgi:uncharacterized membrane protein
MLIDNLPISARYTIPLAGLTCLAGAFLLFRRYRTPGPRTALGLRLLAAAPLVASGCVHLARPQMFVALLPPPFPQQAWLIVATGLPELLGAVGLFVPQTRRATAVCLSIFLVAIFPANIYVAGQTVHGLPMPDVALRTGMQAAYMLLVLVAGWGVPVIRGHFDATKS